MARFNPPTPALTTSAVRLVLQLGNNHQIYETTLDYIASLLVAPANNAPFAVGTAYWAAHLASLSNCFSSDTSILGLFCSDISSGLVPSSLIPPPGAPIFGTQAGFTFPGMVSSVVTKNSAVRGQHGRGRNYVGPVSVNFISTATDANLINATGVTAYGAWFTGMVTTPLMAAGASWKLAVTTRPVPPATLVTHAAEVTGFNVRTISTAVRRRREGRGI